MAYKADKEKTQRSFDPIPAGDYTVALVKAEKTETKDKNGHYLACQYNVIKGKYKGRIIWSNMNLDNANDQAVEIAERELNSLMFAVGVTVIPSKWNLKKLYNIPFKMKVGIEEASNKKYADKNKPLAMMSLKSTGKTSSKKESSKAPWDKKKGKKGKKGKK